MPADSPDTSGRPRDLTTERLLTILLDAEPELAARVTDRRLAALTAARLVSSRLQEHGILISALQLEQAIVRLRRATADGPSCAGGNQQGA
jgi:hypothetical protein